MKKDVRVHDIHYESRSYKLKFLGKLFVQQTFLAIKNDLKINMAIVFIVILKKQFPFLLSHIALTF